MSGGENLFRTRFGFMCDLCELFYKPGRYAGWTNRRLVCATCLIGADPDTDPTAGQEISRSCTLPTAPTLFDSTSASGSSPSPTPDSPHG